MGYAFTIALRYLASKKRAFISAGSIFSTLGVTLGVAALSIVMSVTGGFKEQFREKVLGVNAHVLVLKYSMEFREYRDVMEKVAKVPGVIGVAPFIINPMMVTHGERTATGVLLKGVDPELMPRVLDLPKHIIQGSMAGLRKPGAKPPEKAETHTSSTPLRDLQDTWKPKPTERTINEVIEERIQQDAAEAERGEPSRLRPFAASATSLPAIEATKPSFMGEVTPVGGFASKLPDDDDLPESIDPDPCKSPEQVAALAGLVVGKSLATQLTVGIGDCVQITSPTVGMSFGGSGSKPPIAKQFRIIAVFEAGFDQYDSKLVYTDLFEAEAFYEQGDSVTGVEMKVDEIDRAQEITKDVEKTLNNGVYHTMDWQELNHGLFTALLIQQVSMSFVLALIILVAAFTVVAALVMVVLDKQKEIALLKAIGAKDSAILRIFLYQGGITGMTGTLLGLFLGYLGCKALGAYAFPLDPKVYFLSRLPVELRPAEFLITGDIAIIICLLATIVPTLYAAWLRPSDGLRSD